MPILATAAVGTTVAGTAAALITTFVAKHAIALIAEGVMELAVKAGFKAGSALIEGIVDAVCPSSKNESVITAPISSCR